MPGGSGEIQLTFWEFIKCVGGIAAVLEGVKAQVLCKRKVSYCLNI